MREYGNCRQKQDATCETHTQCVRVGRSASDNASIVELNPSEEYTKPFSQEIHHTQVTQQAMLL